MENYVGKRLDGRYEIQEIIGVGGMAVVYKAYDNVDDRIVAVKILKDEFSDDAEFVRRFKNESKAIAVLSHPNIVKVYDVSFGEKIQYIVMEYVDGITLKEYIQKQHVITWNDAVFFTTQILKALQHAHDKGIVHRDIKPQNIILLPTGNIKVTDFGIARFSRKETRTLTENAIGSVHYISPEQAKGEATDERADIYSVGVVLYEMLAGKVPFEADSAVSVALMQLQKEPERLTRINPDIPLGIEQICIHAMQKNPADRYQTATEMLLDLEEVIRNPNAVFDYTYFVDKEPTKYMFKEENLQKSETDNSDFLPDTVAEEDPNHKKKVITAVSVGIVVLIAAVVALVLFMTQGLNTNTHKLENFVGQSYDDLVSNSSYDYEFVAEYQTSSDAAAGTVLSQSPEAETRVISGSKVTLYVASSDESLTMPNCYNLTLDKAERALEMSKLTNYKVAEVSSESVEEGSVVYTEPKASEAVSADQQIVLYISSGPSTTTVKSFKVPDVSGLSQNDAKDFLEKSGFTNITIETEDSPIRKGVVLSQTPSAGNTVKENEAIKLTVSTGVVTTSTQPAERTVTLKIKLPKFSQSPVDTLVVDIDGKKTEKAVVLNGGTEIITFSAYDGDELSGNVSLTDATGGAANNFKISVNGDKTVNIDLASTVGE
ncbi:MAG: Stk1 family PASTA domain-containing Ser/Thr kinase [Clostridiales bacterium]|nr:Stk1 family PASTA domain-containing Ser/Thr kinase [Clostridiales bacterium]